jgi:hypothetical protein
MRGVEGDDDHAAPLEDPAEVPDASLSEPAGKNERRLDERRRANPDNCNGADASQEVVSLRLAEDDGKDRRGVENHTPSGP